MKVYAADAAYQVGTEDNKFMVQVDIPFDYAVDIKIDGRWTAVNAPMRELDPAVKELVHFAKLMPMYTPRS